MWKRVRLVMRTVMHTLVLLASEKALAQTTDPTRSDSTLIISTTAEPLGGTPLTPSGIPFYDLINPSKEGFRPTALYSSNDRIFVGLRYNHFSDAWSPDSSGTKNRGYVHYSLGQKAMSIGYQGIFNHVVGKWNLFVDASYDWVRWTNFYGLGNNTLQITDDNNFYRVRSSEALLSTSLQRRLGKQSRISVTSYLQRLQLLQDPNRILSYTGEGFLKSTYDPNNFLGFRTDLLLQRLNDLLLPTKGVTFSAGMTHIRNLDEAKLVTNYLAYFRFYVPLGRRFVFSVENGAATLVGEPEFYQYNSIGGNSLRGYRRDRFWGETVYHNNNELQYLFNAPAGLFRGKLGLLVFGDQGRVWKKGEQSNDWHYGYGGGIIIAPYQKAYFSVQYGISKERKGFHFEFRRSL